MSAGQHTPGPWRVDECGDIVSGPYNVCIPYATKPADKALMAAAPDLLEALQRAEDRDEERRPYDDVEMCADDGDVDSKDELWRRQQQRAAIARATGAA